MEILSKIQTELKAPKNQYNNFGKYSYRSCEDILEGLKPLLKETGAVLNLTDDVVHVGERYYIKATATLTDKDGCKHTATAYAREPEHKKGADESQVTGAASSYARKYALNGLFCIDDNKDADATNTHGKGEPAKVEAVTPDQVANIEALASEVGANMQGFLSYFKVGRLADLPKSHYDVAIKMLEKKRVA